MIEITKNKAKVTLGNADVGVALGFSWDEPNIAGEETFLVLHNLPTPTKNINDEVTGFQGKNTDEIGDCIEIQFTNPDSVDVVIQQLSKIKANLLRKQAKEESE